MLTIRKVLHPTDYSDLCRPAFEFACSLARDFGAELVVCHVSPPPIAGVVKGVVIDLPTGETAEMQARLERVKPDDAKIRVTHALLRGDPAAEIVRLAQEAGADAIVMGTHGRGGLGRLLMGSAAEAVMRKAPCPVITVKAATPAGRPETTGKKPATA